MSGGIERPTVVFILCAPRSGSTWLNRVLGSHEWAMGLGEYFRPFLKSGHVACRLCEAEGLAECTVLGDIASTPAEEAFHLAARRSGRDVLIDASKRLDWCEVFLDDPDLDVRLLHLVRHPAGFLESELRRHPDEAPAAVIARWEQINQAIEQFIAAHDAPSMTVSYDRIADDPERFMPAVCDFIGRPWNPAALEYWRYPHHGLGGNGAASVYLRGRKVSNFRTGDDAFYEAVPDRPTAADRRWKTSLPSDLIDQALSGRYATDLAARLGVAWER